MDSLHGRIYHLVVMDINTMVNTKELIELTEDLQKKYTDFLNEEYSTIPGELRVKLGIAESKLFKIAKLMRQSYAD